MPADLHINPKAWRKPLAIKESEFASIPSYRSRKPKEFGSRVFNRKPAKFNKLAKKKVEIAFFFCNLYYILPTKIGKTDTANSPRWPSPGASCSPPPSPRSSSGGGRRWRCGSRGASSPRRGRRPRPSRTRGGGRSWSAAHGGAGWWARSTASRRPRAGRPREISRKNH